MKIVPIIACIFLVSLTFSQNSYYFSNPLPSEEKKVQSVDKKWFGEYNDEERSLTYSFSADGLTIISTQVSSVSKKLVRESSTYSVRGKYIHGVVENDSLPCLLKNGYYFFGIRNRDAVVYPNSPTLLTRISDREYVLNYYENGKYSPVKLAFSRGKLTVSEFDYEPDERSFDFIQEQNETQVDAQNIILLSPTNQEFNQLNTTRFFVETNTFSLITD